MIQTADAGSASSASQARRARRKPVPAAGGRDDAAVPEDALIVFMPSGRRGRFAVGTPVLQAARRLGVDIDSVCGGRGICGRCQVTPAFGSFAKHGITSSPDHLTQPNAVETE